MASDAGVSGVYSTTGKPATIPTPSMGGYIWETLGSAREAADTVNGD